MEHLTNFLEGSPTLGRLAGYGAGGVATIGTGIGMLGGAQSVYYGGKIMQASWARLGTMGGAPAVAAITAAKSFGVATLGFAAAAAKAAAALAPAFIIFDDLINKGRQNAKIAEALGMGRGGSWRNSSDEKVVTSEQFQQGLGTKMLLS